MFGKSEVFWGKAGPLRNSGKHATADLFAIMKSECVIRPSGAGKNTMGAVDLTLHRPPDREERGENPLGLG